MGKQMGRLAFPSELTHRKSYLLFFHIFRSRFAKYMQLVLQFQIRLSPFSKHERVNAWLEELTVH